MRQRKKVLPTGHLHRQRMYRHFKRECYHVFPAATDVPPRRWGCCKKPSTAADVPPLQGKGTLLVRYGIRSTATTVEMLQFILTQFFSAGALVPFDSVSWLKNRHQGGPGDKENV